MNNLRVYRKLTYVYRDYTLFVFNKYKYTYNLYIIVFSWNFLETFSM